MGIWKLRGAAYGAGAKIVKIRLSNKGAAVGDLGKRLLGIRTSIGLEWTPEYRQQVFDTVGEAVTRLAHLEAALRECAEPFTFTVSGELLNEFNRRQGVASKALSPKR